MQPARAAHGAFLARPSWGPRKAGRLCGERRSSVVIELSCLHGSERYGVCFDARQAAVAGVESSRDPFHEL